MRRAARIDANQHEIVEVFREFGFSVLLLHRVGNGCPDILIAKNLVSALVEIKDGDKPLSAQNLTPDEKIFHAGWRGLIRIVRSRDEAVELAMQINRLTKSGE